LPFTLNLEVTRNGEPALAKIKGTDRNRSQAESAIRRFNTGQMPLESTIKIIGDLVIDGSPGNEIAWRFADIKRIWIEEN
jgi:hypothetical protein